MISNLNGTELGKRYVLQRGGYRLGDHLFVVPARSINKTIENADVIAILIMKYPRDSGKLKEYVSSYGGRILYDGQDEVNKKIVDNLVIEQIDPVTIKEMYSNWIDSLPIPEDNSTSTSHSQSGKEGTDTPNQSRKQRINNVLLIAGVVIGVLCLSISIFSTPTIMSVLFPTSTPTATSTPTETSTPTATPSATYNATITNTATITFTPSITPSPTMTFTPTITFTPTKTPTETPDPRIITMQQGACGTTLDKGEYVCIPPNVQVTVINSGYGSCEAIVEWRGIQIVVRRKAIGFGC